jgi:hypothetical protein
MERSTTSGSRWGKLDLMLSLAVLAMAVAIAASMYSSYLAHPQALWQGVYHDRNGHYGFALDLAVALRSFDLVGFVNQLEKAKIWPPLHGLALATVLAIGGLDYRLAVLPNLAAWVAVVVLTALIARALFSERLLGWTAAGVAVVFTLTSPALRLLATDVMLDVPGAALSALALFTFANAIARPADPRRWRLFALTLTACFFEKSNYFMLIAVALAITWLSLPGRLADAIAAARALRKSLPPMKRLAADPLLIGAAIVTALVVGIFLHGPTAISLMGHSVSLYPPRNLITVVYALLFIRVAMEWRHHRQAIRTRLDPPARSIFYFTLVPIACSLLLPQRLAVLAWYVGPTHYGPLGSYNLGAAARLYSSAFLQGFSVAPWSGCVALALFLVALALSRRLPPTGRAVLVFATLSSLAVIVHPQHQGRFLTPFVFAIWIGAGAGLALLVNMIPWHGVVRAVLSAAVITCLGCALLLQVPDKAAAAMAAGRTLKLGSSDLDLIDAYAPFVTGTRSIAVASTFGPTRLFDWPLIERCSCRVRMDTFRPPEGDRDAVRAAAETWLTRTRGERLLVFDFPEFTEAAPLLGFDYNRTIGIVDAVAAQNRFQLERTVELPAFGGRVSIWRRRH